jgi:hypothetical protein
MLTRMCAPLCGAAGSGGTGADGTGTTRPTAGDEIVMISATYYGPPSTAFYTKGLHVMQSSDGQCTRVLMCRSNICPMLWVLDKAKSPIAAWTAPYFACIRGSSNSEVVTYAGMNDVAACYTKYGATTVTNFMTSTFYGTQALGEAQSNPEDTTQEYPMSAIGLASTTATHRGGRKGTVFDLWWGSGGAPGGTTYPEDGTKQFAQIGHLVFPWNGTTVKIS